MVSFCRPLGPEHPMGVVCTLKVVQVGLGCECEGPRGRETLVRFALFVVRKVIPLKEHYNLIPQSYFIPYQSLGSIENSC